MGRMLPPYTKPHLSFQDQIQLLLARGLTISDQPKALLHLERIGYGRLAPYWEPLRQTTPHPTDPAKLIHLDPFKPGAEFRHVVDLYLFDKQLRLLFLDAVERFEVALRVDIAHTLGRRDPWAHLDAAHLDPNRAGKPARPPFQGTHHQEWRARAEKAVARSKEGWMVEFRATYSSPLPIWMAVEAWDYGTLSQLLEMAHPNDRAEIARRYGLLPNTLVSWTKTLNFIRNLCAHHARLWNKAMVSQPLAPKVNEAVAVGHIGVDMHRRTRVYGAAVIAAYLVRRLHPTTSWVARMKKHWQAFPAVPHVGVDHASFFPAWEHETIWQ